MASTKQMLEALLKMPAGTLPKREQEQAEDIWDGLHRYGKLSSFQHAWVAKRYTDYKLDRSDYRPPAPMRPVKTKVGYIEDEKFSTPVRVATLAEFERSCPHHPKGSPLWHRAASFLRDAGHVIELRPPKTPGKSG